MLTGIVIAHMVVCMVDMEVQTILVVTQRIIVNSVSQLHINLIEYVLNV